MDKARFLIETHLRTGKAIGELAKAHGIHRSWLYKLLARYRREGPAGLQARSKRPHRSPARISDGWADEIVSLRKSLADLGVDAGAETIHYHLATRHGDVPSVATIWRVLRPGAVSAINPTSGPKAPGVGSWPCCRMSAGRRMYPTWRRPGVGSSRC